jgi:hypothetical protein
VALITFSLFTIYRSFPLMHSLIIVGWHVGTAPHDDVKIGFIKVGLEIATQPSAVMVNVKNKLVGADFKQMSVSLTLISTGKIAYTIVRHLKSNPSRRDSNLQKRIVAKRKYKEIVLPNQPNHLVGFELVGAQC